MRSNAKLLRLTDRTVFSSLQERCERAHLDEARVRIIANEAHRFYKRYNLPKKTGGFRVIYQPTAEVKAIQVWILRNILDKLKPSSVATAFVKNISLRMNVEPHTRNRYFLCYDLADFFPSISSYQLAELFGVIGYSKEASI